MMFLLALDGIGRFVSAGTFDGKMAWFMLFGSNEKSGKSIFFLLGSKRFTRKV